MNQNKRKKETFSNGCNGCNWEASIDEEDNYTTHSNSNSNSNIKIDPEYIKTLKATIELLSFMTYKREGHNELSLQEYDNAISLLNKMANIKI